MYLNYDSASATIILSLNSLNSQLKDTETQLSTGNAINSAADNPVIWAEASAAQSRAAIWGNVANEISNVNVPEVTTATGAITTVLSTLTAMQTTIESVQSGSTTAATALSTLTQSGLTLSTTVADATAANGVNLLDGSTAGSTSFVEGYNATGSVQSVSFTTQSLADSSTTGLLQTAQATTSATPTNFTTLVLGDLTTNLAATAANITKAIADVTSYSSSLGDMSSSETTMQTFAQTMQSNLQNSGDDLIGANLSNLSARETALQTQIQLATQALSISYQSSQLVLKLFQ